MTNSLDTLRNLTASQDDAVLLASLLELEKNKTPNEAERMMHAVIADTLLARLAGLGVSEDAFDAILFSEDFDGTFGEALMMSMVVAA